MAMDTLHDLFEHELKDLYDAESRLVDALRKQAGESSDPEIRRAFDKHLEETRGHKRRIERVFELWGREPSRGSGCEGIQGLLEEHKQFTREDPAGPILDVFNLTAAAKVERYEISAYESLIRLADQMGLEDVVELLEATLDEEENALETVLDLSEAEGRVGAKKGRTRVAAR